jgi:hypothetical protein
MKQFFILLSIFVLVFFSCKNKTKNDLSSDNKTPISSTSIALPSPLIEKTTLNGDSFISPDFVVNHAPTYPPSEDLPALLVTDKYDELILYDNTIGFKTRKELPLKLRIIVTTVDGISSESTIEKTDNWFLNHQDIPVVTVYSCFFTPYAFYKSGIWKFEVYNNNEKVFTNEKEIKCDSISFVNTEVSPNFFTDALKPRSKQGDIFYIYYSSNDFEEQQINILFKKSPDEYIPILSCIPKIENGLAHAVLKIGNDLEPGQYIFSIGKTIQTKCYNTQFFVI